MEQFDLSLWLKDKSHKVVTRDGRPVRIVCWDRWSSDDDRCIVGLVDNSVREDTMYFDKSGHYSTYSEGFCDLLFADELSEDEKIRKGLIKGLSAMRDIHHHQTFSDDAINIDDAISWLEKQGGQKPADKVEQKLVDNLKWDELTWEDINTLEEIINNVHYEFRNGIGEESFGKEVLERFRETKGEEYVNAYEQKQRRTFFAL